MTDGTNLCSLQNYADLQGVVFAGSAPKVLSVICETILTTHCTQYKSDDVVGIVKKSGNPKTQFSAIFGQNSEKYKNLEKYRQILKKSKKNTRQD